MGVATPMISPGHLKHTITTFPTLSGVKFPKKKKRKKETEAGILYVSGLVRECSLMKSIME